MFGLGDWWKDSGMNATDTLPHVAALDVQIKRCGNAQEVS